MSTTKTRTAVKELTPGAKVKKESRVINTVYKSNVLDVNKALKNECKSLGGARSILLTFADAIKLQPKFVKILKESKKPENYEVLKAKVRTSKNGNYCAFYLLQALNQMK